MLLRILIVLALCSQATYAADTPASEASVKLLLEVAHARSLLDTTMAQMDAMMKNVLQAATDGQKVSPEVQRMFDRGRDEVVAMMKKEFTWDKIEPMYLRIYEKSLTQEEVNGMIAFYKTPAGQAVITKMPLIMQNSMAEVWQMMGRLMQRVQQMQKDLMAQVQAEKPKSNG